MAIFGGGLEADSEPNIIITSANGNPRLVITNTWMESDEDNILIVDHASNRPLVLDMAPLHMYVNGTGNYANIRSTTTSNHLATLNIRGGYWETTNATGYHVDCTVEQFHVERGYFSRNWQGFNMAKITYAKGMYNSGVAVGTSPITVAHNLAVTPTVVTLGAQNTTTHEVSWTADATNIYIYHDSGTTITVSWYAEIA